MRTEKKCPSCEITYKGELSQYFYRSSRRTDGLDWRCKPCKAKAENENERARRDKRRYEKSAWKVKARDLARKHYASLTLWCHVLGCKKMAQELHHVDYKDPLAVVPLCKKHHEGIHD